MSETRRVRANRRNARKSTGPRTSAGRKKSANNALRHGLSAQASPGGKLSAEIDALTLELMAGLAKDPVAVALAREAAVAQIQMQRIFQLKKSTWAPDMQNHDITKRGELFELYMQHMKDLSYDPEYVDFALSRMAKYPRLFKPPFKTDEERREAHEHVSLKRLTGLIRYERQYANRRDRALKALSDHLSTR